MVKRCIIDINNYKLCKMRTKHILLIVMTLFVGLFIAYKNQPIKEVVQVKVVHDTIYKVADNQVLVDSLNDYKQALATCLVLIKKKNFQLKSLKSQLNESTTIDDSSDFGNDYAIILSKRYQK